MSMNRQVFLVAQPDGIPQASHFALREAPVPEAAEGQVLVRNRFLSVDPAMRGWVSPVANYSKPVAPGETMRCSGFSLMAVLARQLRGTLRVDARPGNGVLLEVCFAPTA